MEDNIWACIYRARDVEAPKAPATRATTPVSIKPSSGTSMSNHSEEMVSSTSGKQPQITSLADSSKGYEESDNDRYDSILSKQINFNKERSRSEKLKMRSIAPDGQEMEEEEVKASADIEDIAPPPLLNR